MENKLSTLNVLQGLIKDHKKKSLGLLQSKFSKHYISTTCDDILQMIEELKEVEKEQSRKDWKAGYIECTINLGEFFGNERVDSFPNDNELEIIERLSHHFIDNRKLN
jgi:hypothetical protein